MFPPPPPQDADAAIRQTDTDAALARLSAVQKQYLSDPFVQHLIPRAHLQPPRPPLINIGTFVRSTAIDDLVYQWLGLSEHEGKPCQIVSLGSGHDTRFWRIATGTCKKSLATYIELDFPEITSKKVMAIRKSKELSAVLGDPADIKLSRGGTTLHSPTYHLLPVDLRLPPSDTLAVLSSPPDDLSASNSALLSPSLPTLLLFECVLVYMSPSASSSLIQWFVNYFSDKNRNINRPANSDGDVGILGSIVYEMFGLGDAFGRVMLNNLKTRNVSLPGAEPYQSPSSLPNRFLNLGFTAARALTLREIRGAYISPPELARISKLEMLDEMEELDLVLEHYAITWGLKFHHPSARNMKAAWGQWGLKIKEFEDSEG